MLNGEACLVSQVEDGLLREVADYACTNRQVARGLSYYLTDYPTTASVLATGGSLLDLRGRSRRRCRRALRAPRDGDAGGPARSDRGRGTRLGPDRGLRHEDRASFPGWSGTWPRSRPHRWAPSSPASSTRSGAAAPLRRDSGRHSPTRSKPRMRAPAATPKRSSGSRSPLRPSSSSSSTRFATWSSAPSSTTSGRCGVPESILNKPGPLTRREWEIMKTHPEVGEHILQPIQSLQAILPVVRHHHERWDGSGYPDGLAGRAIPLGARIVAVCDAYRAMSEDPPCPRVTFRGGMRGPSSSAVRAGNSTRTAWPPFSERSTGETTLRLSSLCGRPARRLPRRAGDSERFRPGVAGLFSRSALALRAGPPAALVRASRIDAVAECENGPTASTKTTMKKAPIGTECLPSLISTTPGIVHVDHGTRSLARNRIAPSGRSQGRRTKRAAFRGAA